MAIVEREKVKNLYEMAYLLPTSFSLAEAKKVIDELTTKIQALDGEIKGEPFFTKKKLAYPIKKQTQSYFGYFRFQLEPENLESFQKGLRLDERIMRYLIISVTPKQIQEEEKLAKRVKKEIARKKVAKTKPSAVTTGREEKTPKPIKEAQLAKKLEEIERAVENN